ncbi:PREDICTED: sorting nexin-20 [Myotis brandtii]|uniref:sorting nexin-20 n=1 Tax=Myotis brandtii TaxID=109478 RepID=UPI000703DA1A|nr:PREDICTED: sorting nexin-20 [Myotis brandtii]
MKKQTHKQTMQVWTEGPGEAAKGETSTPHAENESESRRKQERASRLQEAPGKGWACLRPEGSAHAAESRSMASAPHPGSPGWAGLMAPSVAGARQEVPAAGPGLPPPEPEGDSDGAGSPSAHSGMTTRELQEYWQGEKGSWKPVKLLFEIASARIEEEKLSRFVVSTGAGAAGLGFPSLEGLTHTHPQFCWGRCWGTGPTSKMARWALCQLREARRPVSHGPRSPRGTSPLSHVTWGWASGSPRRVATSLYQLRKPGPRGLTLKELAVREYLS